MSFYKGREVLIRKDDPGRDVYRRFRDQALGEARQYFHKDYMMYRASLGRAKQMHFCLMQVIFHEKNTVTI